MWLIEARQFFPHYPLSIPLFGRERERERRKNESFRTKILILLIHLLRRETPVTNETRAKEQKKITQSVQRVS